MLVEAIHTDKAPSAIGTYSQAIKAGSLVFISGQIPLSPETNTLINSDIEAEIVQVLENLKSVAEASGGALSNIVRITVFMTDLSHFQTVNEVMARYFEMPYPARAAVEVSALPKGARVEMDAIMVIPSSRGA